MTDAARISFAPFRQLRVGHVPVGEGENPDIVFGDLDRGGPIRLLVAAVAVEHDDPPEAVGPDAPRDVVQHRNEGLQPDRDRADLAHVVVSEAVGYRGRDDDREVVDGVGRGDCEVKGDGDVDIVRAMRAVLLDRPDRHDHDGPLIQRRLELAAQDLLPHHLLTGRRTDVHDVLHS